MTTAMPPIELVDQPRIQDINSGRPYRIAGIPIQTDGSITGISYWLEVTADDKYGSTVVFSMGPGDLPIFELTGAQTAQLGTLLAAVAPCGFDNTGGTTSVGWYRIYGQGTDNTTTETVTSLSGHGPVLVRLGSQLRRKERILLGYGSCGCAGGAVCGCGNGAGCTSCDHPPVTTDDGQLTSRARVKGRWRGAYSDLTPPDSLGPYQRYDVVVMPDGTQYVYVGPADGVTPCLPPYYLQ